MAGSLSIPWLLQSVNCAVLCGAALLVQTTLILTAGFCVSHLLRKRGAAAQSLALRAFLAAALLCPLAVALLHTLGVPRIHITLIPASLSRSAGPQVPLPLTLKKSDLVSSAKTAPFAGVQSPAPETPLSRDYRKFQPGPGTPRETPARPADPTSRVSASAPSGQTLTEHSTPRKHSSPSTPAAPNLRALLYIAFALLWVLASFSLLLRLLAYHLAVLHLRRTAFPAKPSFEVSCQSIAAELGFAAPPVIQHPEVSSPFLTGFLRPCILLPLGEGELALSERAVFLHELAHLARRDTLWNLIRHIGVALLPFQPLLWVLSRRIEETSDFVCDDFVTQHTVSSRLYAANLLETAWAFQPSHRETAAGVGFVSLSTSLRRRIARILDTSRAITLQVGTRVLVLVSSLCLCITFLSGLVGLSFAQARKLSETLSRSGMPAAIAALTMVRAQVAAKLQPSEPTDSSDQRKNTPASAAETVPPVDQSTPAVLAGSDIPAQNPEVRESAATLSESAPDTAFSPGDKPQNTGEIPAIQNTSMGAIHTAPLQHSIDTSSKLASADSLWQRGLPDNSVKALTPKVNTDFTPAALDVLIPYNYKNADKTNPEEKRWSDIYEAADRNQISPVWSPDGKRIAFSDANYCIWMAPSGGGELTLVYDNYHKARYGNYDLQLSGLKPLCFSPGGKEITFAMEMISEEHGTIVDILANQPNIYYRILKAFPVIAEVNIGSGEKRIIAEDARYGSWSHDGRYFVYQRDSLPELHLKDMRTGGDTMLLNEKTLSSCFTPSDRYIVFSREIPDGAAQIFRIPVTGGIPEQLTFPSAEDPAESRIITDCSPNGEWILFTGSRTDYSTLGVYNMVTGSLHDLFPKGTFLLDAGKFSYDGKKICYSLSAGDADGPIQKLFTCNFTLPSEATPAQVQEKGGAPISFILTGNYPNPFNMSTTIQFALPSTGFVRLTIYNIMGQKVRELVARELATGSHSVIWNGKDEHGNTVSTGVFVTRLQWNNHTATRRMTLVK